MRHRAVTWTNTFGKHNRDCYNQVGSKWRLEMIDGAHIIIYSKDAESDKAFIKNVLKFKYAGAHNEPFHCPHWFSSSRSRVALATRW